MREPISFSGAAGNGSVAAGVRLSVGQPWLTFKRCLVQAREPGHTHIRIASQSRWWSATLGSDSQKTVCARVRLLVFVKEHGFFATGGVFFLDKKVHRDVSAFYSKILHIIFVFLAPFVFYSLTNR
jgi:hypothetical protein